MKLPHDQSVIDAIKAEIAEIIAQLEERKLRLKVILSENRLVERSEEIRTAQKMTPSMRDVLERMANGEILYRRQIGWSGRYENRIGGEFRGDKVSNGLRDRLILAGYISHDCKITDAGRKAIGLS